jgi:hypothetical protein
MTDLHIELSFLDYGNDSFDKKLKKITSHQGSVYIWDDVHPWFTHANGITMLKNIRGATNNKLFLVCRGNHGLEKNYLNFEVIEFSHTAIDFMKWHEFFSQEYVAEPNNSKGTFLFLTGKPLGYHRVGLLYKIWKNNLIDQCRYSFFGNTDEFKESCAAYIDFLDQELFFRQVDNQSPDSVVVQHTGPLSIHYLGIPYDRTLYQNTQFSVVSETYSWQGPPYHTTEKIWRAILNCHPFMLAGQPGLVDFLESLGFDCYRSYLKKDYEKQCGEWNHHDNDNLITNINQWLHASDDMWDNIKKVALSNQKNFFAYLQKNKDIFKKLQSSIEKTNNNDVTKSLKNPWKIEN